MQQLFEIICIFLDGSKARGCYLVLNGTFGHLSKRIPRENGSARYLGRTSGPLERLLYSVHDWEEDGSIGSVAVNVKVVNTTLHLPVEVSTLIGGMITGKSFVYSACGLCLQNCMSKFVHVGSYVISLETTIVDTVEGYQ